MTRVEPSTIRGYAPSPNKQIPSLYGDIVKTPIIRRTPIGAILFITLLDSETSLPAFIANIGYRNIPLGIRAFHSWMNTGTGSMLLLERIQESRFAIEHEVLFDALHLTENQILQENHIERERLAREQAAAFIPKLYGVPQLDPTGHIVLFATTRDFESYSVELPRSLPSSTPEKQYAFIQEMIRETFQRSINDIPPLGPIVSYLYRRHWNEAPLAFTTDGELLGIAPEGSFQYTEHRTRNTPIQRKLFSHFLCSRDGNYLH